MLGHEEELEFTYQAALLSVHWAPEPQSRVAEREEARRTDAADREKLS